MNRKRKRIATVKIDLPTEMLHNARAMRRNPTLAENAMWQLLRGRRLNGWKFRRQHPIADFYILDFYCVDLKVAIEIDGEIHMDDEQHQYDENRTKTLLEYDVKVIRFTNEQVLNNPSDVLNKIRIFITKE